MEKIHEMIVKCIEGTNAGGSAGNDYFWRELEYVLFDVDVAEGCNSNRCMKLYNSGIIHELWEIIKSAESTEDLIPGAKKLVQKFKDLNMEFPCIDRRHPPQRTEVLRIENLMLRLPA